MPKTYVGEFQFGVTSPTDDIDSELQKVKNAVPVDRHAVQHELQNFVGEISQTPPDFSAVKVDGKRAYALSRMGRQVELKPKQVTVHDIEMLDFDYPNLRLAIRCGSGTYIRSIGRDLGKALGTGAIMTALTRTAVGCFKLDTAINLDNLSNKIIQEKLISPAAAFPEANQIVLTNEQIQKLANGHVFGEEELAEAKMDMQNIAIDTSNNLLAVFKAHRSGGHQPELNFVSYYGARNENSL